MPTSLRNPGAELSSPPMERSVDEQKLAEERLRRHVQFLTQVQASTVELLDRHDDGSLWQAIVNQAEKIFGAQATFINLVEGDELVTRACTPGAAFLQGYRLGRHEAVLSWRAIETREPVAMDDYSAHPDRWLPAADRALHPTILLPIVTGDMAIGVIGISRETPGQIFTPDELQMGRLFAQIAALLLRNAGIYDEAVRLAETRTDALRESKKMESLGTLAGGVAHDFNNLLSGMCGYVEIARDRLPPGHAGRHLLGQTLDLGNHARELVRQILTFSRQTIGEYRPLDLSTVVAEAQNLSRFTLPAGAELQTQLATDCPPIAADQTQIQQVLLNLCANASHALPAIGGQITIAVAKASLPPRLAATQPALAGRPVVKLSVSDNGCGMDAATLERIFEPFFTTRESGKGTGLGLAVVHGIVGAHGGALDVRSQPGAGTTFDIFFPALPVAPAPFGAKPEARPPQGHHESILWVDDNDATGEVIANLLGLLHYQVTHHKSGEESLAVFTAAPQSYAMLITDLAMPGLDGEALARAALQVRPDLPVLVVTGMIEPQRQAALLAAGVKEIVFKPVTLAELAQAVARHLPAPALKL